MSGRVSYQQGKITGISVRAENEKLPLLIMIPGGGGSADLFDIGGASFLEAAQSNGFSAVALNRPGQADSALLSIDPASDNAILAANADVLLATIDEIWASTGGNHPGIILYGSSIGGAITLHMAARWSESPRAWPLLGLSVADIGQAPPQIVTHTWRGLPMEEVIDLADYFHLFFGDVPAWTMTPLPPGAPPPQLFVPRAELQEIVGGWPREWHKVARSILVPVQYALAEFDTVWKVSPELIAEFSAALASSSPYVDARLVPDTSHVISIGTMAQSHMLDVLAFSQRCAIMHDHPEMLEN